MFSEEHIFLMYVPKMLQRWLFYWSQYFPCIVSELISSCILLAAMQPLEGHCTDFDVILNWKFIVIILYKYFLSTFVCVGCMRMRISLGLASFMNKALADYCFCLHLVYLEFHQSSLAGPWHIKSGSCLPDTGIGKIAIHSSLMSED